jgi:hypothetical protein
MDYKSVSQLRNRFVVHTFRFYIPEPEPEPESVPEPDVVPDDVPELSIGVAEGLALSLVAPDDVPLLFVDPVVAPEVVS